MRIRTGLGPDDWRDEGQSAAHVSGHGGRMLGQVVPAKFTPQNHRAGRFKNRTPESRLKDNERRRIARANGKP